MASSDLMASSTSRNPDLRRKSSIASSSSSSYKADFRGTAFSLHRTIADSDNAVIDGAYGNVYGEDEAGEATLLNAEISLLDAAGAITPIIEAEQRPPPRKTVEDVWREIVEGKREQRMKCKEESMDEMMTLEDFLVKAGAVEAEVKIEAGTERLGGGMFSLDSPVAGQSMYSGLDGVMGFGNGVEIMGGGGGKGKRRAVTMEPLDKAALQRQRRMIKNRESAARSRERKQAYQVELESTVVRLEKENEQLLREKAERTKERCKQLLGSVIPVVDKRRPRRVLRRESSI